MMMVTMMTAMMMNYDDGDDEYYHHYDDERVLLQVRQVYINTCFVRVVYRFCSLCANTVVLHVVAMTAEEKCEQGK